MGDRRNDRPTVPAPPPPYQRHPYGQNCRLEQILVNFRYHGHSPRYPRLSDHYELQVCACRSVSHVWGLFASQVAVARAHTPSGPPVATDSDATVYRFIHVNSIVAAAFDPRYPIWVFVVQPASSTAHRNRHRRKHRRHLYPRTYRYLDGYSHRRSSYEETFAE